MRVLVVDDEPAVREAVERALRLDGYEVSLVGTANVIVISVLERRSEIGLRRVLGATRAHITTQCLSESLILAGLGGVAGTAPGSAVTVGYAMSRDWPAVVPPLALAAGVGAALAIGAVAGLYPALRAARLPPTEALRSV